MAGVLRGYGVRLVALFRLLFEEACYGFAAALLSLLEHGIRALSSPKGEGKQEKY